MISMNPMLIPGLKFKKHLPDASVLHERIVNLVAKEFQLQYSDVFKKCRKRDIVTSRQISMLFIRMYDPSVSLKTIGTHFGGRDHTTVIHSIRTIKDLMSTDEVLRERVNKIQGMI